MARKRRKASKEGKSPTWLVTFSDMMTLLLTFFVLLLSMAALRDEQKQHLALGSIAETFGMGKHSMNILGTQQSQKMLDPGPFDDTKGLAPIKNVLWEENRKDVQFVANKFIQIVSIQASLLFEPGQTQLSAEGRSMLKRVLPELQNLEFPVLLSGHSSYKESAAGRDDGGVIPGGPHPSWGLSLARVLSVYRFLIDQGISPKTLKLEAFGRFQPRYGNDSREGRRKNRRVDIILDKRNFMAHSPNKLKEFPGLPEEKQDRFDYRGFRFELDEEAQSSP